MRNVLIDVRLLQAEATPPVQRARALDFLKQAQAALPEARLIGLADPALPQVPAEARSLLHAVRTTAYSGAMREPACLVQLDPLGQDPLFLSRLLLQRTVPSAALSPRPAPGPSAPGLVDTVGRYWLAQYDHVFAEEHFWEGVGALRPGQAPATVPSRRPRMALLTRQPDAPLCAALRDLPGPEVFTPEAGRSPLPLLSPRCDRVVTVLANTRAHVGSLGAVTRFGGAAMLEDSSLLAAYPDDGRVAFLAEAELGRPVSLEEVAHWRAGTLRCPALLLAHVAAAAEPLIVHSRALAEEIARRYGVEAVVVPRAVQGGRMPRNGGAGHDLILAFAEEPASESCIWALELLRSWGVQARLALHCAGDPAQAEALAAGLGLKDRIRFAGVDRRAEPEHEGPAALALLLAMPGQGTLAAVLAQHAASGLRCVASRALASACEPPAWVRTIPDEPSPILLAEAVLEALAAPAPSVAAIEAFRRAHDPAAAARRLCEALGISP